MLQLISICLWCIFALFALSAFIVLGLPLIIIYIILDWKHVSGNITKIYREGRKERKELEAKNLCRSYDWEARKWGHFNFVTKKWELHDQ